jgi:hypothetical protein
MSSVSTQDVVTKPIVHTESKGTIWTGRILSALPVLALGMSGVMKIMGGPKLAEGFNHLGWPITMAKVLAILELGSVIIYLIPQTAILGAILITGYMGGAIATHLRIGEPVYLQALMPILAWLGLYLRESRLRALIPLRQ